MSDERYNYIESLCPYEREPQCPCGTCNVEREHCLCPRCQKRNRDQRKGAFGLPAWDHDACWTNSNHMQPVYGPWPHLPDPETTWHHAYVVHVRPPTKPYVSLEDWKAERLARVARPELNNYYRRVFFLSYRDDLWHYREVHWEESTT